jgi:hypothetical protein
VEMVSKAWKNIRIKQRKLLGCAMLGYLTTTLYQMDGKLSSILINFRNFLYQCHCMTLGAGWTNIWTSKKLPSAEKMKKNSKFVHRLHPSGRICYPHHWHKYEFSIHDFGHLVTISKKLSSKILLRLCYEQILRLTSFFTHNWLW